MHLVARVRHFGKAFSSDYTGDGPNTDSSEGDFSVPSMADNAEDPNVPDDPPAEPSVIPGSSSGFKATEVSQKKASQRSGLALAARAFEAQSRLIEEIDDADTGTKSVAQIEEQSPDRNSQHSN